MSTNYINIFIYINYLLIIKYMRGIDIKVPNIHDVLQKYTCKIYISR